MPRRDRFLTQKEDEMIRLLRAVHAMRRMVEYAEQLLVRRETHYPRQIVLGWVAMLREARADLETELYDTLYFN